MGIKGLGNQANTFGNKFVKALGGDSTGKDAVSPAPVPKSGMVATGGVISDYTVGNKIYRSHVFTSTGEFTITDIGDFDPEIEYIIVAGGGAGGSDPSDAGSSGGGGAGGYRSSVVGESTGGGASLESKYPVAWAVPMGAMQIRVGAGGAALPTSGGDGNQSWISGPAGTISATGGGGGGWANNNTTDRNGRPGGSGGGAGQSPSNSGPSVSGQGYPGGNNSPGGSIRAGGGGGAAGPGLPGGASHPSGGGPGLPSSITGFDRMYAGGGGGGDNATSAGAPSNHPGVPGGGGWGNGQYSGPPANGVSGTGGGGAGCGVDFQDTQQGGHGGSGIVVLRYQIGELDGVAKATGGYISFYNGKTIHTFKHSGSMVFPGSFNETVEYVVVGGGGSGGYDIGGGGGAGGYMTGTTPINMNGSPGTRSVQVGAGAASLGPFPYPEGNPRTGIAGVDSFFAAPAGTITGGGGAGGASRSAPSTGHNAAGSGSGGGGAYPPTNNAGTGGPGGNPGGAGQGPQGASGGGGGAGGAGQNVSSGASNGTAGAGGLGVRLPSTFCDPRMVSRPHDPASNPFMGFGGLGAPGPGTGDAARFWVAGGGGGGAYDGAAGGGGGGPVPQPYAGAGAGAPGADNGPQGPANSGGWAAPNTGSGGGGNKTTGEDSQFTGRGGSGLVLLAYPT